MAFDAAAYFDTDPALVRRAFNRPTTGTLATADLGDDGADTAASRRARKRSARERDRSYTELEGRLDRSAKMARLAETMAIEKELLKKGKRVKVAGGGDDGPPVFKWKSQRKR